MAENKIDSLSKIVALVATIITIIGILVSIGVYYEKLNSKIDNLSTEVQQITIKIEKQQDLLLKQQEFNGKVLSYIDIKEKINK